MAASVVSSKEDAFKNIIILFVGKFRLYKKGADGGDASTGGCCCRPNSVNSKPVNPNSVNPSPVVTPKTDWGYLKAAAIRVVVSVM